MAQALALRLKSAARLRQDYDWRKLWCRFWRSSANGFQGDDQKRTACTSET